MGKTHCAYIHDCLYNFNKTGKSDPTMSKSEVNKLRQQCLQTLKGGQKDLIVFLIDKDGPQYKFTNTYYSILKVDQNLLNNNNSTQIVQEFAANTEQFRREFAFSINRTGGLKVLTGKQWEIRVNCRVINKNNPNIK
ncbi:Peroxidase [Handroanthus impetiginosus]|uniref:peroxidase n=1 Tax=Handroanthus impetiginosus TaxID=429701 RepID=A0A2G9I9L0_9LAMI|nr:Peroxidase [Handroanthus impetiginosus]